MNPVLRIPLPVEDGPEPMPHQKGPNTMRKKHFDWESILAFIWRHADPTASGAVTTRH
jgi:hypothetical protein